MPEAVTQAQFYAGMKELQDAMLRYHKSQREHIDSAVDGVRDVFTKHEDEDRLVEKRVTRIEEQRAAESNAIAKLSAMTSAIVTAILYAGATLFKKLGS